MRRSSSTSGSSRSICPYSRLFQRSRRDQARLLGQTLTVVVKGIDRPAQLRGAVMALGERHASYGVRDEHYETVGRALLWTLEAGLKNAFMFEVRDAWVAAYGRLGAHDAARRGGLSCQGGNTVTINAA